MRKSIDCGYPDIARNHSQYDRQGTNIRPLVLQPFPAESNASAIYFTAPRIFRQARLELPRLYMPIPVDVASFVGDAASIRSIATTFFQTAHTWMPIIAKRDFFTRLLNPLARRQTELSLLALCMLLCSNSPDGNGDSGVKTDLYQIAKRYHFEVESTGALSVPVLQSAVLIAVYEVGHAIYPAAYLTIGACARLGIVLGIDKLGLDLMGSSLGALTWIEIEERRRVWWAILLLDRLVHNFFGQQWSLARVKWSHHVADCSRYVNLGNPGRQLATEDPTFDTYLPVDDDAWDDCVRQGPLVY